MAASMAPPAAEHDALADRCLDAALALSESAARAGFRGPDPFDGLWWSWPRALAGGRRRRQAIAQLHARAPFDVRRLYRRRHPRTAKALGVFASVEARAQRLAHTAAPRDAGLRAVELLDADRDAGPDGWGYPWDVQTRWSFYPAGSPNVVVTAFAASGLLEVGAGMGRGDLARSRACGRALGPRRALDRARGLLRLSPGDGP